ncbi:efflux RND transporter periplasmic adaptor subunit [Roseiterribacter gracilis]|uniref:RND transporter n=1 Tax=Roseiterribacter gracilis TaxID=2812848 RepID=A0A8S8XE45_9PROT|nr:RND transporter [Rhodospirillales bacterium TMPK1]
MRMNSRRFAVLGGLVLVAAVAWVAFGRGDGGVVARREASVPVRAAKAELRDVPLEVQTVGLVQARETVAVRPRVDGQIISVHFKDGDRVEADQKLFTLDPRSIKAQLAQAEAMLVKDRATLAQARADIQRYTELVASRAASQQKYEQAKAMVETTAASVQADEAQVENLRAQLSWTDIRAPIAGRVGTINLTLGAVVKTADATPLVTINAIQPVRVQLSLPQRWLVPLRKALQAGAVDVAAARQEAPDVTAVGRVEYVDNNIDAQTGAFVVKASFENNDETLWPGMFVNCRVKLSTEGGVVAVPSSAVRTNQGGTFVFVIRDDKTVKITPVKVGRVWNDYTVLESGISSGETVVTDGHLRLADGTKIEIRTGASPVAAVN